MSRAYLQHGRRHVRTGSDPIPGIPGVSWIVGHDPSFTVVSRTTPATQYDFTDSITNTNDTDAFAVVASNGLTINESGFYLAIAEILWSTAAAAGSAECVWNLSGFGLELYDMRPFAATFGGGGGYCVTNVEQAFPVDPSSVGTAAPLALKQNSGGDATLSIQFAVMRLTDDYGDF